MANTDLTGKNYPGNYAIERNILDMVVTRSRFIDTTAIPVGNVGLVSGDTYQIFKFPANTLILRVFGTVVTAEGAADTVDIQSNEGTPTVYISNLDVNTADASTGASNIPDFFAAAQSIDVKPDAAIAAAKFYVSVEFVVLSSAF